MNLIYLTAVGRLDPRFLESVGWCVTTLRQRGRFRDDILVVTDQAPDEFPAALRAEVRLLRAPAEQLCDPAHARGWHDRYLTARLHLPELFDLTPYDQVMYLDADILAIRPLDELFDTGGQFRYGREFQPMTGGAFSHCLTAAEREQARWLRGINSGAFAAPAALLPDCIRAWRAILDRQPDGIGYDQPALNAAILRGAFPARAWPALSIGYPALAYFDQHFGPAATLLHYCGARRKKFVRMKQHFDELMADRPLTVHFPETLRAPAVRPLRIAIDDDRGVESFALVNKEYAAELTARGHTVGPLGAAGAEVVLFHNYTRDFALPPPEAPGKYVAVRSSDFGPYPPAWVRRINEDYDQLWVHTEWIREQALAGGVDPALIRLVPNGINPQVFGPSGPRRPLPTAKRFKFLFVGGAVVRKGIDVLLRGYAQAFTRADDVCLVIKDHARNVFYKERVFRDEILRQAAEPAGPEILYLDDHLPAGELAALYRACDVSVFPFRCEGFNIPALESLACGTPTMVPEIGACVDFSTAATSFLLPATRVRLPVKRRFDLKLGFSVEMDAVDFCEVKPATLAAYLRRAYETPAAQLAAMGRAGMELAHGRFTWRHVVDVMEPVLAELADGRPPRRHRRVSGAATVPPGR